MWESQFTEARAEAAEAGACGEELDGRTLLAHELALALHDHDALAVLLDVRFRVWNWLALLRWAIEKQHAQK